MRVRRCSGVILAAALCPRAHSTSHIRAATRRRGRAAQLAHIFGHVREPTSHDARRRFARATWRPRAEVGVSGTVARELRDHAARRRRRHVFHRGAEHGARARRAHGPALLALSIQPVGRRTPVLRPREPRRGDARRNAFMATIDSKLIALDAVTGQPLWQKTIADPSGRLRDDARAARRQGQSHRRCRRRRVRHPRLHRGVRRERPAGGVAVLHDPGARRARLTRRGPRGDAWKHGGASVWLTGSTTRAGSHVLGHRQSRARLESRRSGPATTCTPTASSRSTPTRAS